MTKKGEIWISFERDIEGQCEWQLIVYPSRLTWLTWTAKGCPSSHTVPSGALQKLRALQEELQAHKKEWLEHIETLHKLGCQSKGLQWE